MKKEFLIKSLNLNAAEALTLEKAEDRMEFQVMLGMDNFFATTCDDKCRVVCNPFGQGTPCNPMTPPTVPDVPPPTQVPCPQLK
ncbi:MAG TPA: hypothetical protein DEQ38_04740 [Elusimicrobia bacterium]|nr:MAG: hypothetical protein A2089_00705 [Elusimicrobia bacterium GWD2_63_28]HCC47408.1 hypothetical protein [Elusimicrobiota bacterium]